MAAIHVRTSRRTGASLGPVASLVTLPFFLAYAAFMCAWLMVWTFVLLLSATVKMLGALGASRNRYSRNATRPRR